MGFQKRGLKPFEKDFPAKDNYTNWQGNKRLFESRDVPNTNGRNNKSYQYAVDMVHTFNSNDAKRSPTTSASEYKGQDKNKFLKMPWTK